MKRFAKTASAIALAGAMTLGAAPAQAQVVPNPNEGVGFGGNVYHNACFDLLDVYSMYINGNNELTDSKGEVKCEPIGIVDDGGSYGSSAGVLPLLSVGLGAAALSAGANGSSEKPAEQPAPAPAPEAPKGPEKGVKPGAEKGVKPAAPAAQAPAKRGMLAQTGANSVAPVAIMFALTIAGAAAFILRRKSA
ncbi:LPXTG cell wall anchor domain-containing protein [Corynebacterium hindlerae]|uniref:LPXTG cell wall anchor domain-containing protein n=1 Tax=Corynebacterium hindlerae TaxID=699041 RepID=UPI0031B68820